MDKYTGMDDYIVHFALLIALLGAALALLGGFLIGIDIATTWIAENGYHALIRVGILLIFVGIVVALVVREISDMW